NKQITTLLDVSRLELGQFRIELAPVDVAALASRVVLELEPTLERHTLHLSRVAEPLIVEGDERLLEQVLQNLLGNAVKYSVDGGTITIRLWPEAGAACVSISDQGMGIPLSAQPHLFQRFYRATNVEGRRISGLGIGLYLVHEIVTHHGGTVNVTSTEGAGSTFTVRLPLASSAETAVVDQS
ncbi:MAG: HAMP domain-containing histidine kinase, partial [Chloroflexota bacterium]|nr:HAMP domain-containing histidine kinase [Chloroflexota bacterium]